MAKEPKGEAPATLKLTKQTFTLQQWPLRPGWKFSAQIMALLPQTESDQFAVGKLLSEENCELAVQIMAHGIEAPTIESAKATVEALGFADSTQLLEAVLRHNLGFLMDLLQSIRSERGPATTRQ